MILVYRKLSTTASKKTKMSTCRIRNDISIPQAKHNGK